MPIYRGPALALLVSLALFAVLSGAMADPPAGESTGARELTGTGESAEADNTGKAEPSIDYSSAEALQRAKNLLLIQTPSGGWPRRVDLGAKEYSEAEQKALREKYGVQHPAGSLEEDTNIDATLLERATTDKIDFLARVFVATDKQHEALAEAAENGLFYLLACEAPKKGYQAFYPTPSFTRYWHRNVLFTDDVSFATVELLRQVSEGEAPFDWIDERKRTAAAKAVDRFRKLLVEAQIRIERDRVMSVRSKLGKRTGWCERHNSKSLTPAWGREFEPSCISPATTAQAVRWLMAQVDPNETEKEAIHAAIAWLHGRQANPPSIPQGTRQHWPKCIELIKNRPIFGDNVGYTPYEGRPVDQFFHRWQDVSDAHRNEQDWFVPVDVELLTEVYPRWRAAHDPQVNSILDSDEDGMIDSWEKTYGLNPRDESDAHIDSDSDGADNLSEYHAGTHPTISIRAPSDRFYPNTRVTVTTIGGEDVEVRYSSDGSEPGRKTRRYRRPIRINDTLTIQATAFIGDKQLPKETATFHLVGEIHHLPFDGNHAESPVKDLVGIQGLHVMGPKIKNRWGKGRLAGALRFAGDGGHISFSSNRLHSHEGAISLWLRPEEKAQGKKLIFHAYRHERDRIELSTRDGRLAVRLGLKDPVYLGEEIPKEKWTHLALVWDWGKFDVYRDGQHVHRGDYQDFDAERAIVGLGGNYRDKSQTFVGLMDDLHIYNRTISADEARQLYDLGAAETKPTELKPTAETADADPPRSDN